MALTLSRQEPSAPTVDAPRAPSAVCCNVPKIENWMAPTRKAKQEVVTQPEMSVPIPSSASVFAPVRV